jgi:hypothetical protein
LRVSPELIGWAEATAQGLIFADGSAHRIFSDLSALMPTPDHRLLIAGDYILFGYGEHGDVYFKDRYATVFARAEALGLRFVVNAPDEWGASDHCRVIIDVDV